jgi:hypothetical protein
MENRRYGLSRPGHQQDFSINRGIEEPQMLQGAPVAGVSDSYQPISRQGSRREGGFRTTLTAEAANRAKETANMSITSVDDRSRMGKTQLIDVMHLDLKRTANPELRNLLSTMIHFIDAHKRTGLMDKQLPEVAESCSGVRFFATTLNGEYLLYQEWLELLEMDPKYVALTPNLVVDIYKALKSSGAYMAPSMVEALSDAQEPRKAQQIYEWIQHIGPGEHPYGARGLQLPTPGISSHPHIQAPTKRVRVEESDLSDPEHETRMNASESFRKKARTTIAPGVQRVRKNGSRPYAYSNGHLRVWREILEEEEKLPPTAVNGERHEVKSNCTPDHVNITLCDFPLSAEEILTVSVLASFRTF